MDRIPSAVVIGGSVAGLLAARVLAEHAELVTILDRDPMPAGALARAGVPQGTHVHALLPGGAHVIEELLPGIGADFVAAGSPVLDMGADVSWHLPAGRALPVAGAPGLFTGSRPLLESVIRRRVLDLPGIDVVGGAPVAGLQIEGGAVLGVRLRSGEVVAADVVVDASGRTSRAPGWLTEAGYDAPAETVVDADLGYASLLVSAPGHRFDGLRAGYVQIAGPGDKRGGIAFPVEGDRIMLTLVGTGGDHPPRDTDGFRDFARSLRDPMIADLLDVGVPQTPISVFGATANRFRHYERLGRLPAGFLVTGDAACAFNPVYGQGMSAAAMAAGALGASLARERSIRALTRRFPRALKAAVKVPWMLATAADFDMAGIRPPRPVQMMNRYVADVMAANTWSGRCRSHLLGVMALTASPAHLFAPGVVLDVVRQRRTTPASAGRAAVDDRSPSLA